MSETQSPAAPTITFDTPLPPAPDPVQERIAHYESAGLKLSEAEARYQVDMERRIDADPNKGKLTPAARAMAEQGDQTNRRFEAMHNEHMQPAASATEFQLPRDPGMPETPERIEQDVAIRSAMANVGLPAWVGTSIGQSLYDEGPMLASMSPEQLNDLRGRTYSTVESMWGVESKDRMQRLQSFIKGAVSQHPALLGVARLMDLSPTAIDVLSQFVEHRHRVGR